MKTAKLFILISLAFFSCEKDEENFNIEITNPFNQSILVKGSALVSTSIPSYGSVSLTGVAGEGSLYAVDLYCEDNCTILGEQGSVSGNTNFNFIAGENYSWIAGQNSLGTSGSSNNLIGTWYRIDGCITANGSQSNFKFNSNGTGHLFQADCNSACDDNGVFLYFNWTDNGGTVTLNYTGNNAYCGVNTPIPKPDTLDYSIDGNQLSIAGAVFKKH